MRVSALIAQLQAMPTQAEVYFDFEGCEDYMVFDSLVEEDGDVVISLGEQPEDDEDEED